MEKTVASTPPLVMKNRKSRSFPRLVINNSLSLRNAFHKTGNEYNLSNEAVQIQLPDLFSVKPADIEGSTVSDFLNFVSKSVIDNNHQMASSYGGESTETFSETQILEKLKTLVDSKMSYNEAYFESSQCNCTLRVSNASSLEISYSREKLDDSEEFRNDLIQALKKNVSLRKTQIEQLYILREKDNENGTAGSGDICISEALVQICCKNDNSLFYPTQ